MNIFSSLLIVTRLFCFGCALGPVVGNFVDSSKIGLLMHLCRF